MKNSSTEIENLVLRIKAMDRSVLKEIYEMNFTKIENHILKNNGSKDAAKDLYQEAFLSVWKNIRCDKFTPKSISEIQGYLYVVAKNKWTDYLRSPEFLKRTAMHQINTSRLQADATGSGDVGDAFEGKIDQIIKKFDLLEEGCRLLLTNFYYKKKSLREIANELNIGEASARNKKYRCIEKLRALVLIPIKSQTLGK